MGKVIVNVVALTVLFLGCQSGLYKVTTSEDNKNVVASECYYEVDSPANFLKDGGNSPDGVLYDEDKMPLVIDEGSCETCPDKPGWSGVLWLFSLGIFPMCYSKYMTQDVTIKTPIGDRTGFYRVDAKHWTGWIPLFVGYPDSADERDSEAKLPNRRLERVGRDRLVKNLVGEFSREEYRKFAKSKNKVRQAEFARIKEVSKKVDELIGAHKFVDAEALISHESQSRAATRKCDEASWKNMSQRVVKAHMDFDKKRVEALIESGKLEEAVAACDAKDSLLGDAKESLRSKAIEKGFEKLLAEVSKSVDECIAKDNLDEANEIIKKATSSPFAANRGGFGGPAAHFSDIQTRVDEASKVYDKKHVQSLIGAGKFEEAIAYCDKVSEKFKDTGYAFGVKKDSLTDQLKKDAVAKAVKELHDVKRLLSLMKTIQDTQLRDDVVMKLKDLNSVGQLSQKELTEIAKTTKRDEVAIAIVDVVEQKPILLSMLHAEQSANVVRRILAKLANPDMTREFVWGDAGSEEMRVVYVDVYGTNEEIANLTNTQSSKMTRKIVEAAKSKISDSSLTERLVKIAKRNQIQEQAPRAREEAEFIVKKHLNWLDPGTDENSVHGSSWSEGLEQLEAIESVDYRSLVAVMIFELWMKGKNDDGKGDIPLGKQTSVSRFCSCLTPDDAADLLRRVEDKHFSMIGADETTVYWGLAKRIDRQQLNKIASLIKSESAKNINFGGFRLGMSKKDWGILLAYHGVHSGVEDDRFLFERITFSPSARYKIFEKEDGEFWSAFLKEFVPAPSKKKSLGETISDAIDSSSFDYQSGYDSHLEEQCYIYKSIKYGTKVVFGLRTGRLVFEEYK